MGIPPTLTLGTSFSTRAVTDSPPSDGENSRRSTSIQSPTHSELPEQIPASPGMVERLRGMVSSSSSTHNFSVQVLLSNGSTRSLGLKLAARLTPELKRALDAGLDRIDEDQILFEGEEGEAGHCGGSLAEWTFEHEGQDYSGSLTFDKDGHISECALDVDGECVFSYDDEDSTEASSCLDDDGEVSENSSSGEEVEELLAFGTAVPVKHPLATDSQQERPTKRINISATLPKERIALRDGCIAALLTKWDLDTVTKLTISNDMEAIKANFSKDILSKVDDWLELRTHWLTNAGVPSDMLFITRTGKPVDPTNITIAQNRAAAGGSGSTS